MCNNTKLTLSLSLSLAMANEIECTGDSNAHTKRNRAFCVCAEETIGNKNL